MLQTFNVGKSFRDGIFNFEACQFVDNAVNKLLTNTEVADLQLGEISYAD